MSILGALVLTTGVAYSSYVDQENPEPSFKIAVSHEEYPVYLWGSYENLKFRLLGQPMGKGSIIGAGVGVQKDFGKMYAFMEIGYGMIDEGAQLTIQQETVFTELVGRHSSDSRPVPVYLTGNYDQESYGTEWTLDDSIMGRVGVGYHLSSHVDLSIAYRPFFSKEYIRLFDEEWMADNGGGWWQESRSKDLSSIEFTIQYNF